MERKSQAWRIAIFAGSGIALGAALGLLFGLMLLGNVAFGSLAGVVIGAVIGLGYEAQSRRRQTD